MFKGMEEEAILACYHVLLTYHPPFSISLSVILYVYNALPLYLLSPLTTN